MLSLILLILAFVLALVAAFSPWRQPPGYIQPHFGWLALAVYLLSLVLAGGGIR